MRQNYFKFLICFSLIILSERGFANNTRPAINILSETGNCNLITGDKKENKTVSYKLFNVEKEISDSTDSIRFERRGLWAKRLGIGSLISILIPFVNVLSLPAAITAIVLGASSIKKIKNKKNARLGITFGIITAAFALLVIGIAVLVVKLGH